MSWSKNLFIFLAFISTIFIGTNSIRLTGRKTKIPYEPDRRVPINIPEGNENDFPDEWNRLDAGKFSRSIDKAETERMAGTRDSIYRSGPDTLPANSSDVCLTKDCVTSAADLLNTLDETVKPCQDFYSFVCGGYIDKAIIPEHSGVHSTLGDISRANSYRIHKLLSIPVEGEIPSEERKLRDFYSSCLNVEEMERLRYDPLFSSLESIGIVNPMLSANSGRISSYDPEEVCGKILSTFMADTALFGLDYSRDLFAAKERNLLLIYQPSTRLPPSLYNKESPYFGRAMLFYEKFLIQAAKELMTYFKQPLMTDADLSRSIIKSMALEIDIANILVQDKQSFESMTKTMSFGQFTEILKTKNDSRIDFSRLIKSVVKQLTDAELTNTTQIILPHASYFQKINSVLDKYEAIDIVNYMTFQKLLSLSSATTEYMRKLNLQFNSIFTGSRAEPPRWQSCTTQTISLFGAKVSQLFVEDAKGMETKKATELMIEELRESFSGIIKEAAWMDSETQTKAIEKLKSITTVDIVYGDQLTQENVAKVFKNLNGISNTTYLSNLIALNRFWTKKELKKTFDDPQMMGEVDSIGFDSTLVNAMYSPEMNLVWLPKGIQMDPVFNLNRISALNYGPLGSVVGHELTHGFDNMGSQFDKDGNLKNWWSEKTGKAFIEKQKCFVNQYNNYTFPFLKEVPNYTGPIGVNGAATLGENIADNGGLLESFRAYKAHMKDKEEVSLPGLSKYTNDQLFFMSYARVWCETKTVGALIGQLMTDPHPPAKVRVQAVMSNSPEFQEAFQCSDQDPMVAKPRCRVW